MIEQSRPLELRGIRQHSDNPSASAKLSSPFPDHTVYGRSRENQETNDVRDSTLFVTFHPTCPTLRPPQPPPSLRQARLALIGLSAGFLFEMLDGSILNTGSYVWGDLSLVLVGAGLRLVGVVSGMNVLGGHPEGRTSVGAALVDTTSQLRSPPRSGSRSAERSSPRCFTGDVAAGAWTSAQTAEFRRSVTLAATALAVVAAALVLWAALRTRPGTRPAAPAH